MYRKAAEVQGLMLLQCVIDSLITTAHIAKRLFNGFYITCIGCCGTKCLFLHHTVNVIHVHRWVTDTGATVAAAKLTSFCLFSYGL